MKSSASSFARCSVQALARASVLLLLLPPGGSAQRERAEDAPPQASPEWLERVGAELQEIERRFSPLAGAPGGWSAPHRSQELRSRVSASGLEVFPREIDAGGTDAPWRLFLATSAFGRPGEATSLSCRGLTVADARAELDHALVVEWFENSEEGIEQGWT